jgi:hypothetical protein
MKGLFDVIFSPDPSQEHFLCCYSFRFLTKLLDKSLLKQCDLFIKIFASLALKKVADGLRPHLESPGLKVCKIYSYQLLHLYRGFSASGQSLDLIFKDKKAQLLYQNWEASQTINSLSSEGYTPVTLEKTQSQRKQSEPAEDISDESSMRNRSLASLTIFQNNKTLNWDYEKERHRLDKRILMDFYFRMRNLGFHKQTGDRSPLTKIINSFTKGKKSFEAEDFSGYVDTNTGLMFARFVPKVIPIPKLKFFTFADLLKTGCEFNKDNPNNKGRSNFELLFEYAGVDVAMNLEAEEICNLKNVVMYMVTSEIGNTKTKPFFESGQDKTMFCTFLLRLDVELTEDREIVSIQMYGLLVRKDVIAMFSKTPFIELLYKTFMKAFTEITESRTEP